MTQEDEKGGKKALSLAKRTYLTNWIKRNPLATRDVARQELVRVFGESVSTPFLNSVIQRSRDQVRANARGRDYVTVSLEEDVSPPPDARVYDLIRSMRALRVTKIELHEDGQFSYEVERPAP